MELKNNLNELIKYSRFTKAELARECGINAHQFYSYCTGKRFPSIKSLFKIAQVLDTPVESIYEPRQY